jgi:hypothetical protein
VFNNIPCTPLRGLPILIPHFSNSTQSPFYLADLIKTKINGKKKGDKAKGKKEKKVRKRKKNIFICC